MRWRSDAVDVLAHLSLVRPNLHRLRCTGKSFLFLHRLWRRPQPAASQSSSRRGVVGKNTLLC